MHQLPFGCCPTHAPPAQYAPAAQLASPAQLVGHPDVVPWHRYGAQLGLPLAPAPSSVHVPGATWHASHAPLHPVRQQYPSTQCPLTHS